MKNEAIVAKIKALKAKLAANKLAEKVKLLQKGCKVTINWDGATTNTVAAGCGRSTYIRFEYLGMQGKCMVLADRYDEIGDDGEVLPKVKYVAVNVEYLRTVKA